MKTKRELEKEVYQAEKRALIHFEKISKIENILRSADKTKEMYYITVEKIKKVIRAY